jgi:hypothetical protein
MTDNVLPFVVQPKREIINYKHHSVTIEYVPNDNSWMFTIVRPNKTVRITEVHTSKDDALRHARRRVEALEKYQ